MAVIALVSGGTLEYEPGSLSLQHQDTVDGTVLITSDGGSQVLGVLALGAVAAVFEREMFCAANESPQFEIAFHDGRVAYVKSGRLLVDSPIEARIVSGTDSLDVRAVINLAMARSIMDVSAGAAKFTSDRPPQPV